MKPPRRKPSKRDQEVRFRANAKDRARIAQLVTRWEVSASDVMRRALAEAVERADASAPPTN